MEIEDIKRLVVRDGDVLVVRVPGRLSQSHAECITEQLRAVVLPKVVQVVVLNDGATIDILDGGTPAERLARSLGIPVEELNG